jgi:hypothetical protein
VRQEAPVWDANAEAVLARGKRTLIAYQYG